METLTGHRDAVLPADDPRRAPLEGAAMIVGSWAVLIGTGMLIFRAGRPER